MSSADQVNEIERWFVQRGVPHLVESNHDASILDTWTRALPLLVAAYVLLGLNALNLRDWSIGQNLATAVAVVAILIATWVVSNRVRGVDAFARPTDIDTPELLLFVFGPALPVLAFGQLGDAVQSVVLAVALLAIIYLWSSYGIGALLRWGARRSGGQLTGLGPLVAKALPLLLVFNTFLFVNAEVWEMAGTLDGVAYGIVVATFFSLGAAFAVSRLPGFIRVENRFDSWADVASYLEHTPASDIELPDNGSTLDPLRPRQRFNIGLIVLFGQALQISLVVVALTGFFVFFGFMAITADTITNWTGLDTTRVSPRPTSATAPRAHRAADSASRCSSARSRACTSPSCSPPTRPTATSSPATSAPRSARSSPCDRLSRRLRGTHPACPVERAHVIDASPRRADDLFPRRVRSTTTPLMQDVWGVSTPSSASRCSPRSPMRAATSPPPSSGTAWSAHQSASSPTPRESALHSHVTGVVDSMRHAGVGRAIKLHQRDWAAERGLDWITWTFDPLVRRNAWFNIAILGADVHSYLPDVLRNDDRRDQRRRRRPTAPVHRVARVGADSRSSARRQRRGRRRVRADPRPT
jgi:hypothetical protein